MLTFIEFYTTLIGFVNFKLFNMVNLHYPPKVSIVEACCIKQLFWQS